MSVIRANTFDTFYVALQRANENKQSMQAKPSRMESVCLYVSVTVRVPTLTLSHRSVSHSSVKLRFSASASCVCTEPARSYRAAARRAMTTDRQTHRPTVAIVLIATSFPACASLLLLYQSVRDVVPTTLANTQGCSPKKEAGDA